MRALMLDVFYSNKNLLEMLGNHLERLPPRFLREQLALVGLVENALPGHASPSPITGDAPLTSRHSSAQAPPPRNAGDIAAANARSTSRPPARWPPPGPGSCPAPPAALANSRAHTPRTTHRNPPASPIPAVARTLCPTPADPRSGCPRPRTLCSRCLWKNHTSGSTDSAARRTTSSRRRATVRSGRFRDC